MTYGKTDLGASAHRRGGCRKVALRPLCNRSKHGLERSTSRRQSIAHTHWRTWVDKPLHDAFGLELAQPFGEDSVAYPWDSREQLIETSRGRQQGFDDGPGPALPYQLDSTLKGRAVVESPSDHGE